MLAGFAANVGRSHGRGWRVKRAIRLGLALLLLAALLFGAQYALTRMALNAKAARGAVIDSFNGVAVYYNGGVNETHGRHLTADGYNLGLKYQCVEFVKRYYHARFGHRMADAYGHARAFFQPGLASGALNRQRGLLQFANGGSEPPRVEDILVFGPSLFNPYGHVAIVAEVNAHAVIVVQQNAGPLLSSREAFPYRRRGAQLWLADERVLGWLRLPPPAALASAPLALAPSPTAALSVTAR